QQKIYYDVCCSKQPMNGKKVMVEYSSPNTNKPLHLGHLRNNFLGWSVAEISKANGSEIAKTCIVNDRGIHICKSMLAWQRFANGATPESTGMKGDHFVGLYYVKFSEQLKKESKPIVESIYANDLSQFNPTEKEKLQLHLSKIKELQTILAQSVGKLDVSALNKLGLSESINAETNFKQALKSFEENTNDGAEAKEKEKRFKELQKILKPLISLEEKINEHREEIKDIAENKTTIMQETKRMLVD